MPSAERLIGLGAPLLTLTLPAVIAGCTTTQQTAARIQLNDARIRASEVPTTIGAASPAVAVGPVQLIATPGRRTFVVVIRNLRSTPISDNPISVGMLGRHGSGRSLNSTAGLPYFSTHLPSVRGHSQLQWVLSTTASSGPRSKPFAMVGRASPTFSPPPAALPSVTITLVKSATRPFDGRREIIVRVRNGSSIPQYQLPVYALADRDGRYVAAGSAIVGSLAPGAATEIGIELFGQPGGVPLQLEAPPTIYR